MNEYKISFREREIIGGETEAVVTKQANSFKIEDGCLQLLIADGETYSASYIAPLDVISDVVISAVV